MGAITGIMGAMMPDLDDGIDGIIGLLSPSIDGNLDTFKLAEWGI